MNPEEERRMTRPRDPLDDSLRARKILDQLEIFMGAAMRAQSAWIPDCRSRLGHSEALTSSIITFRPEDENACPPEIPLEIMYFPVEVNLLESKPGEGGLVVSSETTSITSRIAVNTKVPGNPTKAPNPIHAKAKRAAEERLSISKATPPTQTKQFSEAEKLRRIKEARTATQFSKKGNSLKPHNGPKTKEVKPCLYFNTPAGCKYKNCKFAHIPPKSIAPQSSSGPLPKQEEAPIPSVLPDEPPLSVNSPPEAFEPKQIEEEKDENVLIVVSSSDDESDVEEPAGLLQPVKAMIGIHAYEPLPRDEEECDVVPDRYAWNAIVDALNAPLTWFKSAHKYNLLPEEGEVEIVGIEPTFTLRPENTVAGVEKHIDLITMKIPTARSKEGWCAWGGRHLYRLSKLKDCVDACWCAESYDDAIPIEPAIWVKETHSWGVQSGAEQFFTGTVYPALITHLISKYVSQRVELIAVNDRMLYDASIWFDEHKGAGQTMCLETVGNSILVVRFHVASNQAKVRDRGALVARPVSQPYA